MRETPAIQAFQRKRTPRVKVAPAARVLWGMNTTMRTVPSINSRGRIIAEYLADPDGVHPMRFDNAESANRVASTLGRGWSAFSAQGLGGDDHRWHVRRSK